MRLLLAARRLLPSARRRAEDRQMLQRARAERIEHARRFWERVERDRRMGRGPL